MRFLIMLALVIGWTGCINVSFDQPQPPKRWNKNTFPKSWQGAWVKDATTDTVHISAQSLDVKWNDEPQHFILGEHVVLRSIAGHLVMSLIDDDENGYTVFIAKRTGNVIETFQLYAKDEAKVAIWENALGTTISSTTNAEGEITSYRLAPENNAAFRNLIRQGGFTPNSKLIRAVD